jgi:hypothetical protein
MRPWPHSTQATPQRSNSPDGQGHPRLSLVTKAGFIFGGEFGVGALREGPDCRILQRRGGIYGLQIGIQDFGYALF